MWPQSMKSFTVGLIHVGRCILLVLGPNGYCDQWLGTLADIIFNQYLIFSAATTPDTVTNSTTLRFGLVVWSLCANLLWSFKHIHIYTDSTFHMTDKCLQNSNLKLNWYHNHENVRFSVIFFGVDILSDILLLLTNNNWINSKYITETVIVVKNNWSIIVCINMTYMSSKECAFSFYWPVLFYYDSTTSQSSVLLGLIC